jgi:hypothetical protein
MMGPQNLDFGGDLSAARATAWAPIGTWPSGIDGPSGENVSLGIGWPAGITGTIGCELSNHGISGVAGAPYSMAGLAQPAGTAATALVTGIQPKGACFIRFTWTPGGGNSGASKYFTDDSGNAGRSPTLGQP